MLTSKVRVTEPLFAGDDVIGVGRDGRLVPAVEDPVRTLQVDGTAVDAGLLAPLPDAKRDLLRAVLLPVGSRSPWCSAWSPLRWILTAIGKGSARRATRPARPRGHTAR